MRAPGEIEKLLEHPVGIFGWGVSGRAVFSVVRRLGSHARVYAGDGGTDVCGEFTEEDAGRHRLVVFSPGFAPEHAWLRRAREAGALCLGEVDFAALFWRGAVLTVTGTNGKTTLTDFLVGSLRAQGVDAVAAGNIGYPFTQVLEMVRGEDTVAVLELSSFQTETLERLRPHAVIWTNFAEDHLERHGTEEAYFGAKYRLVERLARPRLLVGESVAQAVARLGRRLPVFARVVPAEAYRPPADSVFAYGPQRENYSLAAAYWEEEGFRMETLEATARHFEPPRHRLRLVGIVNGLAFWNDSKATNFHAALAALKAFGRPVVWIAGGKGKGGDVPGFMREAAPHVACALLLGEMAGQMRDLLEGLGIPCQVCISVEEAVEAAAARAQVETPVLFSPGFASFDMFASYAERGERFEAAVAECKRRASAPEAENSHRPRQQTHSGSKPSA